jgi:hypothetical protein
VRACEAGVARADAARAAFFLAGAFSPIMADLAAVGHSMNVGFAHIYGAFNLAFGVGNASTHLLPAVVPVSAHCRAQSGP